MGKSNTSQLQKFKEYMSIKHSEYSLISETSTTLSYQKVIAASNASCGTAGCLLLLGVIPGIIYYLISSKPEKKVNIAVLIKKGDLNITGEEQFMIMKGFERF